MPYRVRRLKVMQKTTRFLFFCIMFHMGKCKNDVSVLQYKTGDGFDCINSKDSAVVGVPIKTKLGLNEYTFCGKFRFKFMKDVVLMYIKEPYTYIRMMDFGENKGIVKVDGLGYFFFFPNQTLIPDQWQHVCFAVSLNSMQVFLNGELVLNKSRPRDPIENDVLNAILYLGGQQRTWVWSKKK